MLYAVTQDTFFLTHLKQLLANIFITFSHYLLMGVCDWSAQSATVKTAENKLALKIDSLWLC